MAEKDDVIIIGAGVIGLSCAYYLSKEKLKVRVIEKNIPGSGDSTKTGGGIRYFHGSPTSIALSNLSHSFWDGYANNKTEKHFLRNTGHLFISSQPQNYLKFKNQVDLHELYGIEAKTLSEKEIKSQWNILENMTFEFGNYCAVGGYINHHELIKYLKNVIELNGVKLEQNQKVDEILTSGNTVYGVKTKNSTFKGKFVINASGSSANLINELVSLGAHFVSRRHELLLVKSKLLNSESFPWLIDTDKQVHMRTNGKGCALIGGFLGKDEEVNPINYNITSSKTWIKDVIKQASLSFGLIEEDTEVCASWVGLYPGTKDYLPVIELSENGYITAAGFSGTGLMHAPAAGKIVRNLIFGQETEGIDIQALSLGRFKLNIVRKEHLGF